MHHKKTTRKQHKKEPINNYHLFLDLFVHARENAMHLVSKSWHLRNHFAIFRNTIAIDSSILTAHRLGNTIVTGRCIGVNPINAQPVIYSEDSVQIFVVPLERVKIKTPLLRIRSGAIMPATIWGAPNISPMILGNLLCS